MRFLWAQILKRVGDNALHLSVAMPWGEWQFDFIVPVKACEKLKPGDCGDTPPSIVKSVGSDSPRKNA